MNKVTLLFIALWGVISGGINAQSSLPRIMIEVTGELSNEKRVSAVFTLEQTDEATGSTTTTTKRPHAPTAAPSVPSKSNPLPFNHSFIFNIITIKFKFHENYLAEPNKCIIFAPNLGI